VEHQAILLIEDNPDDQALTLRALRKNNIRNPIVIVHDGVEALEYLLGTGGFADQERHPPGLILLDLQLPRMDGLAFLRHIRQHGPYALIPIVVLTSSNEDNDLRESYRMGANSYVRKPVDFQAFLDTVRQLGLYWMVVNNPPPHHP
jgi:CheY-like chemotaxis protein